MIEAWLDTVLGHLDPRRHPAEGRPAVALHRPVLHVGIDLGDVRALDRRAQGREERRVDRRYPEVQPGQIGLGDRLAEPQVERPEIMMPRQKVDAFFREQSLHVGQRTVLEVLNAGQELLVARVNLVTAKRDEYVAGFTLLSSLGQMNAAALDFPVEIYDPEENYKNVRYKFYGWGIKDYN